MSKLRITERIIIGIIAVLIIFGFISRTITGFYYRAINNAYKQGLVAGAQLNIKPNTCKVKDDYYQFIFKDGNIYLTTKNYSEIPATIKDSSVEVNSYGYQGMIKNDKDAWQRVIVMMDYNLKICEVRLQACKTKDDCGNFQSGGGMGTIVDKS